MSRPRPRKDRRLELTFDRRARNRYLKLVSKGVPLDEAAAAAGVDRRTVNKHAKADPAFREARERAKQAGKAARWVGKPHDEYRYIHGGCRCVDCCCAARKARAARRAVKEADAATVTRAADTAVTEPQEGPTVISLPSRDKRSDLPLRPLAAVS